MSIFTLTLFYIQYRSNMYWVIQINFETLFNCIVNAMPKRQTLNTTCENELCYTLWIIYLHFNNIHQRFLPQDLQMKQVHVSLNRWKIKLIKLNIWILPVVVNCHQTELAEEPGLLWSFIVTHKIKLRSRSNKRNTCT